MSARLTACCFAMIITLQTLTAQARDPVFGVFESDATLVPFAENHTGNSTGNIEVAFSPNEGSEQLVIKVIDSARHSLRMLAYSFTSSSVTAALLRAKKRNVDIAMVVDYRANISENSSRKSMTALNALSNAGVQIKTIHVYPIHHDKTIIVDGQTVETGSFNYSAAAAHNNSENVLVLWNAPVIAKEYLSHWERNWAQGAPLSRDD